MIGRWAAMLRRRVKGLPPPAVDAVIAVLCYLATVALPLKVFREGGWPAPVAVAALVGAGTIGLAVTGTLGNIPLPYGQLVATYTVASLAGPVWRLLVMAATAAGLLLSVLLLLEQGPATLAIAALPFVVAYALGVGVRARRDRIAMLEERTRRLAEAAAATAARERERIARDIHDIVAHSVSLFLPMESRAAAVRALHSLVQQNGKACG